MQVDLNTLIGLEKASYITSEDDILHGPEPLPLNKNYNVTYSRYGNKVFQNLIQLNDENYVEKVYRRDISNKEEFDTTWKEAVLGGGIGNLTKGNINTPIYLENGEAKESSDIKANRDIQGNIIHETYALDTNLTSEITTARAAEEKNETDISEEIRRSKEEEARLGGVIQTNRESIVELENTTIKKEDLPTLSFDKAKTLVDNEGNFYNIGNTNNPVFFQEGIPTACGELSVKEAIKASTDAQDHIIHETYATNTYVNDTFTPTTDIPLVKVNNALAADEDSAGNNIIETYATKENSYTKAEIDEKVSAVYKYKGIVPTFSALPTENLTIGDVYEVEDTGENYAWNGKKWDNLGSLLVLKDYLKTEDANNTFTTKTEALQFATIVSLNAEIERAKEKEAQLEKDLSAFTGKGTTFSFIKDSPVPSDSYLPSGGWNIVRSEPIGEII